MADTTDKKSITIVGAGNMGKALAASLFSSSTRDIPIELNLIDPMFRAVPDVGDQCISSLKDTLAAAATDPESTIASYSSVEDFVTHNVSNKSDIVVIAVKPQLAAEVLPTLSPITDKESTVISLMAGVACARIDQLLHAPRLAIIRAMPNLAVQYGGGITTIFFTGETPSKSVQEARWLLGLGGRIIEASEERLVDAATAISGSGPGFLFHLLEGAFQEICALGFTAAQGKELIHETLKGSALLYENAEISLPELEAQVTSPQGTTAAGVEILKRDTAQATIQECLRRAMQRSIELGKEHKD